MRIDGEEELIIGAAPTDMEALKAALWQAHQENVRKYNVASRAYRASGWGEQEKMAFRRASVACTLSYHAWEGTDPTEALWGSHGITPAEAEELLK